MTMKSFSVKTPDETTVGRSIENGAFFFKMCF